MENDLKKKYIQISRIIVTVMAFIILNTWFVLENDPQWIVVTIICVIIFAINYPSARVCKFVIQKGDKITDKKLKVLYYVFALPIIFLLVVVVVGLVCSGIVFLFEDALDLGTAVLIALSGIGLFTCILVPYFQTLIILLLRYFDKND